MKRILIQKSRIHGKGLFADESIKKGEKIQYIPGPKKKKVIKTEKESYATMNWIGISKHFWIDTKGTIFNFINHSCEPNAAIAGVRTLYALEDIPKGKEVFIDYSMTDADPLWQLKCSCKTKSCRKLIRSIYSIPKEVFERHMPYVPRYFQRAFIRSYVLAPANAKQKRDKAKPKKI